MLIDGNDDDDEDEDHIADKDLSGSDIHQDLNFDPTDSLDNALASVSHDLWDSRNYREVAQDSDDEELDDELEDDSDGSEWDIDFDVVGASGLSPEELLGEAFEREFTESGMLHIPC